MKKTKENILSNRLEQKWKTVPLNNSEDTPFPNTISIDVANVCNYRCITCPQAKQDRNPVFINTELCKKILMDAFCAGAKEVCFSIFGEPLLNKKLVDYIAFAKHLGYEYVFLNTNGFLATLDYMVPLLEAGLDSIKFSINTFKDKYKLFHGSGDFDTVYNNLKALVEYKKEKNLAVKIFVSTVAIKSTLSDIKLIQEAINTLVDEYLIKNAFNRGGAMGAEDDYLITDVVESTLKFPCSQLYTIATITSEGYLVICCQDFFNQTIMADLNLCSIQDAWNNEVFVNYRKNHNMGNIKGTLCNNCLNGVQDEVYPVIFDGGIPPSLSLEKESDLFIRMNALKDYTQSLSSNI